MTRVLVTGSEGFIGKHVTRALRGEKERFQVHAVSRSDGDLAEQRTWRALPDADAVIHLAAKSFVPDSWDDPAGFLATNTQGAVNALIYCRERRARLVFVSSYLYGVPERLPIPETAPLEATNPYALSKLLAERACEFFANYFGVSVIVLRPFNIYGPGQDDRFLIPTIVRQIQRGEPIAVKDLEPKRDYVFIDDVVDALRRAVDGPSGYSVVNIASGSSHSVEEVIETIQRLAGTDLPVQDAGERRPHEVMDTRADISRAKSLLAWIPRYTLADGCGKILAARA